MASMKQIKNRKRSVESTGKITKAMKLVATVKLQKTKQTATDNIPYFTALYETVSSIIKASSNVDHKYLKGKPNAKKGLIVLSSNKGLAGGYNSSVVKNIIGEEAKFNFSKDDTLIYSMGSKVRDELKRKGFTIERDYSDEMEDVSHIICKKVSTDVLRDFEDGKIGEIYLIYTHFKNTIVHIPRMMKLLPLTFSDKEDDDTELYGKNAFKFATSSYDGDDKMPMTYEMDDQDMITKTIPSYLTQIIYGGLVASVASENGARMTAMDNATKNAKELSDKLGMLYNRARQGAITQELTEIVAGASSV